MQKRPRPKLIRGKKTSALYTRSLIPTRGVKIRNSSSLEAIPRGHSYMALFALRSLQRREAVGKQAFYHFNENSIREKI